MLRPRDLGRRALRRLRERRGQPVWGDTNSSNDIFLVDRDPDNGIFDEQVYAFERISVDSKKRGARQQRQSLHLRRRQAHPLRERGGRPRARRQEPPQRRVPRRPQGRLDPTDRRRLERQRGRQRLRTRRSLRRRQRRGLLLLLRQPRPDRRQRPARRLRPRHRDRLDGDRQRRERRNAGQPAELGLPPLPLVGRDDRRVPEQLDQPRRRPQRPFRRLRPRSEQRRNAARERRFERRARERRQRAADDLRGRQPGDVRDQRTASRRGTGTGPPTCSSATSPRERRRSSAARQEAARLPTARAARRRSVPTGRWWHSRATRATS